jgi:predicted peroxiredoxin
MSHVSRKPGIKGVTRGLSVPSVARAHGFKPHIFATTRKRQNVNKSRHDRFGSQEFNGAKEMARRVRQMGGVK